MSGFHNSRFVGLTESQKTFMSCGICTRIMNKPVMTQCRHTFCKSCIEDSILLDKTCPECNKKLGKKRKNNSQVKYYFETSKNYNDMFNVLQIKCNFKGCEQMVELGSLDRHIEDCIHNKCDACELQMGKTSEHNCIELLKKFGKNLNEKNIDLTNSLAEERAKVLEIENQLKVENNKYKQLENEMNRKYEEKDLKLIELELELNENESEIKRLKEENNNIEKELIESKIENNKVMELNKKCEKVSSQLISTMSGFDSSRFIDIPKKYAENMTLVCGICLGIMNKPVDTQCRHTFCFFCIEEWINTCKEVKTCPKCRQHLGTISKSDSEMEYCLTISKKFNVILNALKIRCNFEGCDRIIALKSLDKHVEGCVFNKCKTCGLKMGKTSQHNCIKSLDFPKSLSAENSRIFLGPMNFS